MKVYLAGENGKKRIILMLARERDGGALSENLSGGEYNLPSVYSTGHYRGL